MKFLWKIPHKHKSLHCSRSYVNNFNKQTWSLTIMKTKAFQSNCGAKFWNHFKLLRNQIKLRHIWRLRLKRTSQAPSLSLRTAFLLRSSLSNTLNNNKHFKFECLFELKCEPYRKLRFIQFCITTMLHWVNEQRDNVL